MALYEQRIFAYEGLVSLDKLIDREPTAENLKRFIELDIENKIIFKELASYNDKGCFIYEHNLTRDLATHDRLKELKQLQPGEFLAEHVNADKSITRYKSLLNNKKYKDEDEAQAWRKLIEDYERKKAIIKQIVNE